MEFWYGKVTEPQTYEHETGENIEQNAKLDKVIEKVKEIEQITYRESQAYLNNHNIENIEDLEYVYHIKNAHIKLGSNKDWYMIYGEQKGEIMISDLAVAGGIHAEKNGTLNQKTDARVAMFEAANEAYKVMIEAAEAGKRVYCNATSDTSLLNIKSMLRNGTISVKDMNGRKLKLNGNDIVYEETEEVVETRGFEDDEEIEMLDLEIVPNIEKLKQFQMKIEESLAKARENFIMKGTKKEEGIDEMRKEIR